MSKCGSSDSNNVKGLISINLRFNTLAGKNLSWQSSFLEATHTNDYPLSIGADRGRIRRNKFVNFDM